MITARMMNGKNGKNPILNFRMMSFASEGRKGTIKLSLPGFQPVSFLHYTDVLTITPALHFLVFRKRIFLKFRS